jgi:alpha-tubulin suppressor-like RCC1 family protein
MMTQSSFRVAPPWILARCALLLAAVGCGRDSAPPTEPVHGPMPGDVAPSHVLSFKQLSAGFGHTCAVTTAGEAYCWGSNQNGQLGNGSTQGTATPVRVTGERRFLEVRAGDRHTCGLDVDFRAYCWGLNNRGQLGDGTTEDRDSPVRVIDLGRLTALSAGRAHTCAVNLYNRIFCWGANDQAQLGDGTRIDRVGPVRLQGPLREFRQVSAGGIYSCGVTTADQAYCWGGNRRGALGDGTLNLRLTPVAVVGGLSFREVGARAAAGGTEHSRSGGVTTDDLAYCWGEDHLGRLGNGPEGSSLTPVPVYGTLKFARLSVGGGHTCGLTLGNLAYCWGWNGGGALGDGTDRLRGRPTAVVGGHQFTDIAAAVNGLHTCAIDDQAVAYCWGPNFAGQLGNGTFENPLVPTPVAAPD